MRRITISLIVLLAFALVLAACGGGEPANELEAIREAGSMTVGTSADYPPFEYVDEQGDFAGFDIDLITEIANRMEVELEIVDMPFDSLIASVQENKIDLAIAAFTANEERDQVIDFTAPYYYAEDAFLVREDFDQEINSPEDIGELQVGVQTGTTAESWVRENLVGEGILPEGNLFNYERSDQGAMDLQNGRIDVFVNDYIPLNDIAKELGGLKIAYHAQLSAGPMNIVIPEGADELNGAISEIITELEDEGFIETLESRYIIE